MLESVKTILIEGVKLVLIIWTALFVLSVAVAPFIFIAHKMGW